MRFENSLRCNCTESEGGGEAELGSKGVRPRRPMRYLLTVATNTELKSPAQAVQSIVYSECCLRLL